MHTPGVVSIQFSSPLAKALDIINPTTFYATDNLDRRFRIVHYYVDYSQDFDLSKEY